MINRVSRMYLGSYVLGQGHEIELDSYVTIVLLVSFQCDYSHQFCNVTLETTGGIIAECAGKAPLTL